MVLYLLLSFYCDCTSNYEHDEAARSLQLDGAAKRRSCCDSDICIRAGPGGCMKDTTSASNIVV